MGGFEVAVDFGELFFFGATGVELLEVADEDYLERGHQGWRAGAVEDFEDGFVGEVELREAELAQLVGDEGLEDGAAAALVEEDVVAGKDVAGAEAAGVRDFGQETVGGGKTYAGALAHACLPSRWRLRAKPASIFREASNARAGFPSRKPAFSGRLAGTRQRWFGSLLTDSRILWVAVDWAVEKGGRIVKVNPDRCWVWG